MVSGSKTADGIIRGYDVKPPFIRKGFHAHFYPIDLVQLIWNEWGKYEGYYYKLHISSLHNEYWDLFYIPEEFKTLRNHYFARIEKDPDFFDRHYSDWKKSCVRLNNNISQLEKAFAQKSFSKLLAGYSSFIEEYLFEYALAAPVQEACGFQPEQWIESELKVYCEKHGLEYQSTTALLMSPVVLSFIAEEELDLLELALKMKKRANKEIIQKEIENHQRKWFWIQNNYAKIEVLTAQFFQGKAEEWSQKTEKQIKDEIQKIRDAPKETQRKKEALWKKHPPSPTLHFHIRVVERFAEMQDYRKSFVLRANHYAKQFLKHMSEEFSHPLENLWYYTHRELMGAISKRKFFSQTEINARRKMIVEVASKKEQIVLSGEEAQYFFSKLQEDISHLKEIKGIVACAGRVKGTVKIVLKSEDIAKVKKGDILVSSMTRPEMTSAMKIAAAFVTDEGGITCHAAIVSREMNKPCIIGTKIATKVLKDGDMIEVDANKGIVKILKRA